MSYEEKLNKMGLNSENDLANKLLRLQKVEKELEQGELLSVPIRGHSLVLDIFIATLRGYDLPHPTKIFLEYITSITQSKDMLTGIADFERVLKSFNQV